MAPATSAPAVHVSDPAKRKLATFIVLACTLLLVIAQYLIKLGANRLSHAGPARNETSARSFGSRRKSTVPPRCISFFCASWSTVLPGRFCRS
jgi:hypothetical protein